MRNATIMILGVILIASPCVGVSPERPQLGRTLTAIDAEDYRGRRWQLDDFSQHKHLVVAFLGTECPLAKLYATRLVELQKTYVEKGVGFVAVMSNTQDSISEIAAFARRHEIPFPVIKDAGNRIADRLSAQRTPEVFLLDPQRTVRYWGRIDDQYGIGFARDFPRKHDLRLALDDVLAGRKVKMPVTRSIGCIIGRQKKAAVDAKVTYSEEVARILKRRCVECHREGEIAPFALTDYDEVSGWADMIAETVRDGRMPPWHADPKYGQFANDRSMTDEEKQILYDWADAGAPEGDQAQLPEPTKYVDGWLLPEEPHLVVNVSPEPYTVQAEGAVKYQYFRIDPGFEEDKWLRYAELKPGNRAVVHHILGFAVPKGSRRLNAERGYLVGYVPGTRIEPLPQGWAKRIPAGSQLVFQVHYTPVGTEQLDHSKLGMIFLDEDEVTHEIVTDSAVQPRLNIAPEESDYQVSAVRGDLPDSKLLGFSPHMHLRGKAFRYELVDPGVQERNILLDIPAYDFNWQTFYLLDSPIDVEAGSKMYCTATFDNSEGNLNNPDPSARVRWGDQTEDEMMIGYFHYAVPVGKKQAAEGVRQRIERAIRNQAKLKVFDRIDRDGDGKLLRGETPRQLLKTFDDLDANRDGVLLRSEVELSD